MDLRDRCRGPFFKLVANGLLKHSILAVDDEVGATLETLGGLEFLYGLGVANVVNINYFKGGPVVSDTDLSRLDGLRCLFIPDADEKTSGGSNNFQKSDRHLVCIVSGFLWNYGEMFLNALLSGTSNVGEPYIPAFERVSILATMSERGHECAPDAVDGGSFRYDEFAAKLSQRSLVVAIHKNAQQDPVLNGGGIGPPVLSKLNVRFFPLLVRPILADDDREGGESRSSHSNVQCFEISNALSTSLFPPMPHVFPKAVQQRCGGNINKLKISDMSKSTRRSFRGLANTLVCIMSQLGLDPRKYAFSIGHGHSSQVLGETMLTNLTEGPEGLILSNQLDKRQKCSFVIVDRTVDLVAPSSLAPERKSSSSAANMHFASIESMQDHAVSVQEVIDQLADMYRSAPKASQGERENVTACMLLKLTMRAFAVLPPGSILPGQTQTLAAPMENCIKTMREFSELTLAFLDSGNDEGNSQPLDAGTISTKTLVRMLLQRLQQVNLMRSNLSAFHRLVGSDPTVPTYQPLLSMVFEFINLQMSPTNLPGIICLKDYNTAERTVSGVTESLTGLLGGFFSSSTTNASAQEEKTQLLLSDRDIVFIFVVGGLTNLEINAIQSKYASRSTQVLLGTTKLINGDDHILQRVFACSYEDVLNTGLELSRESLPRVRPDDGDGWDNDDGDLEFESKGDDQVEKPQPGTSPKEESKASMKEDNLGNDDGWGDDNEDLVFDDEEDEKQNEAQTGSAVAQNEEPKRSSPSREDDKNDGDMMNDDGWGDNDGWGDDDDDLGFDNDDKALPTDDTIKTNETKPNPPSTEAKKKPVEEHHNEEPKSISPSKENDENDDGWGDDNEDLVFDDEEDEKQNEAQTGSAVAQNEEPKRSSPSREDDKNDGDVMNDDGWGDNDGWGDDDDDLGFDNDDKALPTDDTIKTNETKPNPPSTEAKKKPVEEHHNEEPKSISPSKENDENDDGWGDDNEDLVFDDEEDEKQNEAQTGSAVAQNEEPKRSSPSREDDKNDGDMMNDDGWGDNDGWGDDDDDLGFDNDDKALPTDDTIKTNETKPNPPSTEAKKKPVEEHHNEEPKSISPSKENDENDDGWGDDNEDLLFDDDDGQPNQIPTTAGPVQKEYPQPGVIPKEESKPPPVTKDAWGEDDGWGQDDDDLVFGDEDDEKASEAPSSLDTVHNKDAKKSPPQKTDDENDEGWEDDDGWGDDDDDILFDNDEQVPTTDTPQKNETKGSSRGRNEDEEPDELDWGDDDDGWA